MRAVFLLAIFMSCFGQSSVLARPTTEEQVAFFAERRNEKADFDTRIAGEIDSRTAAIVGFNTKMQAERAAFIKSLQSEPSEERQQRLLDFNVSAREKQKAFQASLPGTKKNKLEKSLDDFDKKAAADLQSFSANLDTSNPSARSESLQQFRNAQLKDRVRIKNNHFNELEVRKGNFRNGQAQKVQDFFNSGSEGPSL